MITVARLTPELRIVVCLTHHRSMDICMVLVNFVRLCLLFVIFRLPEHIQSQNRLMRPSSKVETHRGLLDSSSHLHPQTR
jgi:hypothetical protein